MKAQYAILRFAKYKGPTVSCIEAHNERTKESYASNPDIKTELSKHNFSVLCPLRADTHKIAGEQNPRAKGFGGEGEKVYS